MTTPEPYVFTPDEVQTIIESLQDQGAHLNTASSNFASGVRRVLKLEADKRIALAAKLEWPGTLSYQPEAN